MKKRFTFDSAFKRGIAHIVAIKSYIFLGLILFFASAVVAFFVPQYFTFFDDTLRQLAGEVEGLSAGGIILFLFSNNVTSAFFALAFGIILGIMPMLNALINGALVGYVLALASKAAGLGVIWRLVPHGIFELPAIFISIGMGIYLGMFIFEKEKRKAFFERLRESLNAFAMIVIPLLIVAAVIEGLLISYAA